MSQRNRVARVSGMNNNVVGQQPAPGSFYQADGAPGVTRGPAAGFSVAFGIRVPFIDTILGSPWVDPSGEANGNPEIALPATEYIAGAADIAASAGWALVVQGSNDVSLFVGDTTLNFSIPDQCSEIIGLMSFVPDASEYGLGAVTLATLTHNAQLMSASQATGLVYVPSGTPFQMGGTTDPAVTGDPVANGGTFHTQITSLWLTEGIPTLDQANHFFEASMDAGIVIPQAWAPARTPAVPNPINPDSPTGNYWTADGVKPSEGLGSIWADKLGDANLTRVSPAVPGAPSVAGNVVVSSRQPYFFGYI